MKDFTVCPYSLNEAMKQNQLTTWLVSRFVNLRCHDQLQQLMDEHKEELCLRSESGRELLDTFGADRVLFVIACSLLNSEPSSNIFAERAHQVVPIDYPVSEAKEWSVTGDLSLLCKFGDELVRLQESHDMTNVA